MERKKRKKKPKDWRCSPLVGWTPSCSHYLGSALRCTFKIIPECLLINPFVKTRKWFLMILVHTSNRESEAGAPVCTV